MVNTTIQLNSKLKNKLDLMKIHKRESYNDLIERILKTCSPRNFDKEDLIETIEVLSDPKTMKNIAIALNETGGISFEKLEKDLNI